ncbi:MAG: response regulator [Cyanobacteria bacterium J06634_6]
MNSILIVEDEDKLAAFIARGFKKHGFTTAVATDGAQALQMSQISHYDVILLDLGLPVKDGWTVLKELRARGDRVPVIVMTARSECPQDAIAAQANDYLQKPFRFQQLLETVERQINMS